MFIKKVCLVLTIICIIFVGATNAQTVKITGKVLDSKGSFMIGATIQLYDSTGIKVTSVISDTIGRFTIQDKKGLWRIHGGFFFTTRFKNYIYSKKTTNH